jgi:hypothetical protein
MKRISVNASPSIFHELVKKLHLLFFHKEETKVVKRRKTVTASNYSFFGEQNNFPELNSVQWDEYGNPYIYLGDK